MEKVRIRKTLYIDEETRDAIETFPRGVSMSAIFRCLFKAAVTSDEKEWEELMSSDPEMLKARDAIRRRLRDAGKKSIIL